MATQNIEITQRGWQDLESLGEVTLTEDQVYAMTVRGGSACEVAIADSKPEESFMGHIAKADETFNFTYKGDTVWVKCGENATVVLT